MSDLLSSSTQRLTRQKESTLRGSYIIDDSQRLRRHQKLLETLEQDNFQEDPLAQLDSHSPHSSTLQGASSRLSKGLVLEDENNSLTPADSTTTPSQRGPKRRKLQLKYDVFKTRFRKNLQTLLDEEQKLSTDDSKINYFSIQAQPSRYPPVKLCSVCGFFSKYTCKTCGQLYCSLKCLDIHKDTRCLKFVG